jgi:hypothetical protein
MKMPKMPKMPKMLTSLCTPAKIYAFLALISVLFYISMMVEADDKNESDVDVHKYTILGTGLKVAFSIVWIVFLNYLCKKGHGNWAWFFLFMPILLMLFMVVGLMFAVSYTVGAAQAGQKKLGYLRGSTHDLAQNQGSMMDQMNTMAQMGQVAQTAKGQVEGFNL